jgi:alpha-glucoside transport system substrate-binding protein
MVATGKAVPVPAQTQANVKKYWSPGWQAYATVNGKLYGSPNSANMKSLVWYSPKQFAADGFKVPTTWTEMMAQSKQMASEGYTPWCGGLGSGTATGWPATDWVEEVLLRQSGATVYNNWISHKVKFSDAPVQSAMTTVANWLQDPTMVGNVPAIATTTFQDAGQSIPTAGKGSGCMQLQQASFYGTQFPSSVTVSPTGDVWAYYLPTINPAVKTPVEGGGEFYVAFNKNPATQEAQNFFSSPLWPEALIPAYGASGGWTTANSGVPLSTYTAPLDKLAAKYLGDPKGTFVFDASDAMPAAVGAGTEWTDLTNWFAQGLSPKQVGAEIDSSWPKK